MKTTITFSHTGNLGDIIASLPFCKAVIKEYDIDKINFELKYGAKANYNKLAFFGEHPSGDLMMTKEGAEMLVPLLASQKYINDVKVIPHSTETSAVSLENIRKNKFNMSAGNITRYYERIYPLVYPIRDDVQWLYVGKKTGFEDKIVIMHSLRYPTYCNIKNLLPYANNIIHIGVDSEYEWFCAVLGTKVQRYIVKDFLELAEIINSCKLFISNQTFGAWVAEGLKVHRFILTYEDAPNVIPSGINGFAIHTEDLFEAMLRKHYGECK